MGTGDRIEAPLMFGTGIKLGRWFGIEVSVDRSWFVIAFLIAWSFYTVFRATFPGLTPGEAVLLGTVTALLFFLSVLLHELSHSLVAQRVGIPVEGITLFIFGGVTKTRQEAESAPHEFAIAIVGPVTSLLLAGVFWVLVNQTGEAIPETFRYGLGYLGWLNLALAVFNLLPGLPLDGGRVLRSIVWRTTGNAIRATRVAAAGGKVVAALLIGFGFLELIAGNFGGLWYAAIGWFLFQAAAMSGQEAVLRRLFEGRVAADVMSAGLVTIDDGASVQEAVDDYFLRFDHSGFPVRDDEGRIRGIITLRSVRQIPRDQWPVRQVWSAMTDGERMATVDSRTPMSEVTNTLTQSEEQRVLVRDGDDFVGIITPRDLARWVRRTEELGLDEAET